MNKRTISLFKKLQKLNLTHSFSIDHSLSDDQLKNLHGRLSMNSSAYRIMLYRSPETLEEFNDLVIKSTALGKVTNLEKYILMYGEELGTKKYGELNNLKSMTKENMIRKYGEKEGTIKWDAYRAKQAYTNSFEYKKEKYGMSKEDFDAFNLSRACTLENMIDRHGEKEGNIKWKAHCDRQSYTNGKEYLGDRYEEVNKKKGINLEYFIFKYGEELGHKKYIERLNKSSFYSKKSQVLFDLLINTDTFKDKKCYYATNIGEYGVYDKINKSYKMYDFVCPELNLCIEFNGDHFHGNPKIYESNDFLKAHGQTNTTAVEAWERDVQKNNLITNERGFAVVVVWENDWDNNQQFVIDRDLRNMQREIEFVDDFEVEDLGVKKDFVYDIEVEHDHNFFGNNICVHNSVYSEIEYIVRRKWPDEKDPSKLTDLIDEFVKTEMDPYIDEMYQELARYMNCDVNLLDMKREGIADTFIIRAKKNYIMKIYDMEGVRFADPYYKFMGVESVRTSTPIMVRTALEDCYKIIIDGTQDELRDYVKKFHNSFIEAPLNKIGSPRGVSDVTKYSTSSHKFIEGVTIPIHVRAAVNYNYLVHTLKLGNKCEYIKNGSKIKFLPLKDPNPIKSHVIGFVDDLPEEFGLSDYIDKEAHFGKVFVSPLESFLIYNGWSIEENALLDLFLDSGIDIVAAAIANKKKPKAKVDIEVESLF